jgi:hypothetical protein
MNDLAQRISTELEVNSIVTVQDYHQSHSLPIATVKSVSTFNGLLQKWSSHMSEPTQLFLFWSFSNIIVIPTVNKNICNQPAQPLATLKHTHENIFLFLY